MTTVTFTKGSGDYVASTGERIGFYNGTELWGRGSTGWYITEVNGEFRGIRFDRLWEAKFYIIKRHNIEQAADIHFAKTAELIAKAGA